MKFIAQKNISNSDIGESDFSSDRDSKPRPKVSQKQVNGPENEDIDLKDNLSNKSFKK